MAVTTTQDRIVYQGDGVSTAFSVPFEFFQNSDLTLILTVVASGSTSTPPASISGAGNPAGGTVTLTTALLVGTNLTILLSPQLTQQSNYPSNSPFPSQTVQNDFDRHMQISQRLQDQINRAIRAPDGDNAPTMLLPPAAQRAGLAPVFDNNGNLTTGVLPTAVMTGAIIASLLSAASFAAAANSAPPLALTQSYNYTAGTTTGFVVPLLELTANVTTCGTNYAWTLLGIMNNSAPGTAGSQNVAAYFQGNKMAAGVGPTWALVAECRDVSGAANPAYGQVGFELDMRASGTDSGLNRVGLDLVLTRYPYNTGTNVTFGYGYRVGAFGDAGVTVGAGYTIFDITCGYGVDMLNATITAGAMRMAQGVAILFDGNAHPCKVLSQGLGLDHFGSAGTLSNRLLDAGGLEVISNQVIGQRIGGYGTPTGGSRISNFPGATATLLQTSEMLAAFMTDCITHGFIGS